MGPSLSARVQHRVRPVTRAGRFALAVVRAYLADDGTTWASATAFYLILSLPPLLIAATSIAVGIVGQEAAGDWVLDQVVDLLPAERSLVERLVAASLDGGRTAGVLSIVLLALTGSRVFGTLVLAIEGIWDIPEQGRFWRRQLLRAALLTMAGVILAVSALLDFVLVLTGRSNGLGQPAVTGITAGIVPLLLLVAGLLALYRLVPPGVARWRSALAGALVAAVLIRSAQWLFTSYLRSGADYTTAYGSLASVAILLTWCLLASAATVIGAEVVVLLERPRRAVLLGRGRPGSAGQRGRVGKARDDEGPERGRSL